MSRYGVAFFRGGKFEGAIAPSTLRCQSRRDARAVAARYRHARPGEDYRAVEYDANGYLVWQDDA